MGRVLKWRTTMRGFGIIDVSKKFRLVCSLFLLFLYLPHGLLYGRTFSDVPIRRDGVGSGVTCDGTRLPINDFLFFSYLV